MSGIVCHKQYIQMVSHLNDICVLLDHAYCDICHILCTWIYCYEYSYDKRDYSEMKNVSHTECRSMVSLHCEFCCDRQGCVNRLPQTVHSNGFSPEWLLLCTARSLLLPQHLPHSVHLNLPLWIFIWLHKAPAEKKHFSHWVQVYWFLWVCNLLWSLLSALVFTSNKLSPV